MEWDHITDLSFSLQTGASEGAVYANGRSCIAMSVFFRAKDKNGDDIQHIDAETLLQSVTLIDYFSGERLSWGDRWTDKIDYDEYRWWYYRSSTGESYPPNQDQRYFSDSYTPDQDPQYGIILPDDPNDPNHTKPPVDHIPTPKPPVVDVDRPSYGLQRVVFYITCGPQVNDRIKAIGAMVRVNGVNYIASSTSNDGYHTYVKVRGISGHDERYFGEGRYVISPTDMPGIALHPSVGNSTHSVNNCDSVLWDDHGNHPNWSHWDFIRDNETGAYLIRNAYHSQFHLYLDTAYDVFGHIGLVLGYLPADRSVVKQKFLFTVKKTGHSNVDGYRYDIRSYNSAYSDRITGRNKDDIPNDKKGVRLLLLHSYAIGTHYFTTFDLLLKRVK